MDLNVIQKELEEKKKKIEALKKRKSELKNQIKTGPTTAAPTTTATKATEPASAAMGPAQMALTNPIKKNYTEKILNEVINIYNIENKTEDSAKKDRPASTVQKSKPVFAVQPTVNIDINPVEKVVYEQGIQVDLIMPENSDNQDFKDYEELKQSEARLKAELQALQEQLKSTQAIKDDRDEKKERKPLTAQEERKVIESEEFQQFFSRTSRIVQRALGQFDVTIDYGGDDLSDKDIIKVEEKLVKRYTFNDAARCVNRPVTAVSWSPKYKELLLASYAGQEDSLSMEPDGMVLVWSLHMAQRPEYYFYCQSAVLTAQFHPTNPKLIVGGTASGQIIIWDTREKSTPVNRTSLSRGHTHPIFALSIVPSVNMSHNFVSVSSDGHLCVWNENDLHDPTSEVMLRHGKDSKDECTTTSFDFPGRDTTSVVLGSDEGTLYKAKLYDKAGISEDISKAHDAPITNVQFHPINKNSPSNVTDLYLTSSYDWTCKLWSNKLSRPLFTFESAKDYVYDVQWSPVHPALFASGDGLGNIDVWNLNVDTEVPLHIVNINEAANNNNEIEEGKTGAAISRLRWSEEGNHLAVGTSLGGLFVYEVAAAVGQPDKDDALAFYNKMQKNRIK